jgi:hypothetical protein
MKKFNWQYAPGELGLIFFDNTLSIANLAIHNR